MQTIEIGNLYPPKGKWKSRQCGRIYSDKGICPAINTMDGGQREPKVMLFEDA